MPNQLPDNFTDIFFSVGFTHHYCIASKCNDFNTFFINFLSHKETHKVKDLSVTCQVTNLKPHFSLLSALHNASFNSVIPELVTEEINRWGIFSGISLLMAAFNSSSSISLLLMAISISLWSSSGLYCSNSLLKISNSFLWSLLSAGIKNNKMEFY